MSRSADELYLTDEQHLAIMRRMRDLIADGRDLEHEDSDTTGDKYNCCSWGLCDVDPEFWQEDERMWPDRTPIKVGYSGYQKRGHVTSKYTSRCCPLDLEELDDRAPEVSKDEGGRAPWGCFFRCRVFQSRKCDGRMPKREHVVAMYDLEIEQLETELGRLGDDG